MPDQQNSPLRTVMLTASPVEYAAVRAQLSELQEVEHPEGDIYEYGRLQAGERTWEVVIVEMGMDSPNAALITERALAKFAPDVALFVGVAAGIRGVTSGDLVVATNIYGHHTDKATTEFQTRPEVSLPGYRILERARAEARKDDWLARLSPPPEYKPEVHLGAIVAGEPGGITRESESFKAIRKAYKDALAVETGSYGMLRIVQAHRELEVLVVRGISDLLEGKAERTGWQARASRHAAAFAFHVLAKLTLPERPGREEINEKAVDLPASPPLSGYSTIPHQPYFFGREKELKAIAEAISPEARTWGALIDGPGGIGKTALAIRAGTLAPVEHFPLKIFLSAKVRGLTPAGEQELQDFMLPNYQALLLELARELGEEGLEKIDPNERANAVRRALAEKRALLIIDNVETLPTPERDRLYQFLTHLPITCKAIVTSRRRAELDARKIHLDRLLQEEALALLDELANTNRYLARSGQAERIELYEITHGNPLLISWVAGQVGREGSQCYTIADACEFIQAAPKGNDPLEYVFGDLLDTFTAGETAVMAALTYFSQPARVEWIARIASLPEPAARTSLEDLADRALLSADPELESFYLPPLAAVYLRRQLPEVTAKAGERLANRAYALALENGTQQYDRFPVLEAQWPLLAAALPPLLAGDNNRLQSFCLAIYNFLNFSGRWDERLALSQQAEEKALVAQDFYNAGWRAFQSGWVYFLRGQSTEALACAERCAGHWEKAPSAGARQKAIAIRLRGLGFQIEKNYPAALAAYKEELDLFRAISPESQDVASGLNSLAEVEHLQGDVTTAERDYREALRIARKIDYSEGVAIYTGNLARLALERQDPAAAEALAREALPLAEEVAQQELVGYIYRLLAKALAHQGRTNEGLPYAHQAVDIFTHLRQPDNLEEARAALAECGG